MTATYRGTADEIAKGVPLREIWAEMLGKATGTSKGRGGPMHITDPAHGLMLCTGIVGAGMPIAVGLGAVVAAEGRRQGHRHQLRRRGDEHRRLPRVAQPGVGVVAAGRLRLPEQPVRRAHPLLRHGQEPLGRRSSRGIRHEGHQGRRRWTPSPCTSQPRRPSTTPATVTGPVLLECVTFRTLGPRPERQERVHGPGPCWRSRSPTTRSRASARG